MGLSTPGMVNFMAKYHILVLVHKTKRILAVTMELPHHLYLAHCISIWLSTETTMEFSTRHLALCNRINLSGCGWLKQYHIWNKWGHESVNRLLTLINQLLLWKRKGTELYNNKRQISTIISSSYITMKLFHWTKNGMYQRSVWKHSAAPTTERVGWIPAPTTGAFSSTVINFWMLFCSVSQTRVGGGQSDRTALTLCGPGVNEPWGIVPKHTQKTRRPFSCMPTAHLPMDVYIYPSSPTTWGHPLPKQQPYRPVQTSPLGTCSHLFVAFLRLGEGRIDSVVGDGLWVR